MKIYDCFMYFDEDLVLDLRLNYLSKYVDKFVIVESQYNHKGEKRKLQFDKKKFKEFSNKIIYSFFTFDNFFYLFYSNWIKIIFSMMQI